jgi:hypothetical protein
MFGTKSLASIMIVTCNAPNGGPSLRVQRPFEIDFDGQKVYESSLGAFASDRNLSVCRPWMSRFWHFLDTALIAQIERTI